MKKAFSLIELLVTLIIMSLLFCAFSPVIIKKLKASDITIGSFSTTTIKEDGCLSYNANDDCTSCKDGFNLENGVCYPIIANCISQQEGTCNTCDTGYILSNNVCYPIVSNCETQVGNSCLSCNTGYNLTDEGKCDLVCSCTNGSCESGKTYCTSCNAGYALYDNKCVEGNETNCYDFFCNICTSTDSGTCTNCKEGYVLHNGKCYFGTLEGCNDPTYSDAEQVIKCSGCISGYTQCNSGSCRLSSALLDVECPSNSNKIGCTCVMQYNIGDGKYGENLAAVKTCTPGSTCSVANKSSSATARTLEAACWYGTTSTSCNSSYGGYSGCTRTVCNWKGAYEMCKSMGWRLPTMPELTAFTNTTYSSTSLAATGLMFCDAASGTTTAAKCTVRTGGCTGTQDNNCSPHYLWSSTFSTTSPTIGAYRRLNGQWYNGTPALGRAFSTRCVKDL